MERLAADDYFEAALAVLGEAGSEALTINALCQRLGITKGSFYHHFGGMPAFVTALLEYWEREYSDRLVDASRAITDADARVDALREVAVHLPHATEAALRAWGTSHPEVAATVERVDKRRERHLTDAVAAAGVARPRARVLGRMGMTLLVGVQAREQRPVDLRKVRQVFDELKKLIYLEAAD